MHLNFISLVKEAWKNFDDSRVVKSIDDISVKVSTNHVYRLKIEDDSIVIAKLSYFGRYHDFLEDHSLINALAINLPDPYDQFLSRSLVKKNELYVYRHKDHLIDVWVVFYNPIRVDQMLPKRLDDEQIRSMGRELARFHKTCYQVRNIIPDWSKTLKSDMEHLQSILTSDEGKYEHRGNIDTIREQIDHLFNAMDILNSESWKAIPVFVDWNIGNFSITEDHRFYSRWDYDWFRMSSRVMDFYFFSRVCSSEGDKSTFSYLIDPVQENRFLLFLKSYHKEYPLTREEILFIKEAYRFFILNYVIKNGRYFFHEIYALKLQKEAYDIYFPQLEKRFNAELIYRELNL